MNEQRKPLPQSRLAGSILLELMLVCALLAILLPLLVSPFWQLQKRHSLILTYLDQAKYQTALGAQFTAHWARLLPAGCYLDSTLSLTIGSAQNVPVRLSQRSMSSQSDWLEGMDYGACRVSLDSIQAPLITSNDCDLNVGELVRVASCEASVQAQVTQATDLAVRFDLLGNSVLEQTGILETRMPFYWYVGEGKNGQQALWRTPTVSGNSLELWSGVMALSVSPLLDEDQDGLVDTIDSRYGSYSLSKVRALWVEYLYELEPCQAATQIPLAQQYQTLRGERWEYLAPCQGVANQIIVLNGFG
jgi:hypothetical protein